MLFKSDQSFSSFSSNQLNPKDEEQFSQFQIDTSINHNQQKKPRLQHTELKAQKRSRSFSSNHYNNKISNNHYYDHQTLTFNNTISQLPPFSNYYYEPVYLRQLNYIYQQKLNRLRCSGDGSQNLALKTIKIQSNDNLKKSQFWNGYKFDYLRANDKIYNTTKDKQKIKGLIVNKNKFPKTEQYIKIQQSNELSQKKQQLNIQKSVNQIQNQQQSTQRVLKQQQTLNKKKQQHIHIDNRYKQKKKIYQNNNSVNEINELKGNFNKNDRADRSIQTLIEQNQKLKRQNNNLKNLLERKDCQIEKLISQRFSQNDEYLKNIQSLKAIFQKDKLNGQNQLRTQIKKISIQHTKQLSMLTAEHTRQLSALSNFKTGLNQKENIINSYQLKNQQLQTSILIFKQRINHLQQKEKQFSVNQKWKTNFIRVFTDMIIKLPQQTKINKSWDQKKLVVVGWQIVKAMIQKYLKIGVKFPHFVYENQENVNKQKS